MTYKVMKQSQEFDDFKDAPAVFIDSLFHSREIESYTFTKDMAEQLILESKHNPKLEYILRNAVVLFMPYVNIDSVLYLKQNITNPETYYLRELYRKNMNFVDFQGSDCKTWEKGVDINRNFDFHYGREKTSEALCGEQYRGREPFSEKQSQAIKFIFEFFSVKYAISVHTYGNVWIYPYASEKSQQLFKEHQLFPVYTYLFQLFDELKIKYASCFKELNYLADGVYIDWALQKNAVSFTLQIGQTFTRLSSKQITQKYLRSFIQSLSIMGNAFKYSRTKDNKFCISSYSVLKHDLLIQNQFYQIELSIDPLQKNKCTSFLENKDQLKLIIININDTKIQDEVNFKDLPLIELEQQKEQEELQNSEQSLLALLKKSYLAKAVLLVSLLYLIGLICGLSIFCQEAVGIKMKDEQKNKLSNQMQYQSTEQFQSLENFKDIESPNNLQIEQDINK